MEDVARAKDEKSLINFLIVDSGAFIRNAKLEEIGRNIFTLPEVVNEIRDQATKQRLQVLPYQLEYKTPSAEDILFVTEFSKKTGDYSSLSATDIKVLALAYHLHKEKLGTEKIRTEPVKCNQISNSFVKELGKSIVGFYVPNDEEVEDNEDEQTEDTESAEKPTKDDENIESAEKQISELSITNEPEEGYQSDSQSSDEEDTWITPDNLEEARRKMGALDTLSTDVEVACLTTDFAMQNVLIQIGINVISLDGLLIKQAKTFILRCYACFGTTSIMTKQFCPKCGNKTLKRVAVSISEDGNKTIHLNFRRPINIRGTRYSLPMPKGGKHSINPIVCEDQPLPHNRASKAGKDIVDIFDPAFEVRSSPFARNDIYTRAGKLGNRGKTSAPKKTNPNINGKRTGNKKSKRKPIL